MTGWGRTRLSDEFPGRPLSHGPPCAVVASGQPTSIPAQAILSFGAERVLRPGVSGSPKDGHPGNARAYEKTAQLGGANLAPEDPVDADRVERDDRQNHDPAVEQESQRDVRRGCVGQRRAM